jgi:uncharacterized protein YegL
VLLEKTNQLDLQHEVDDIKVSTLEATNTAVVEFILDISQSIEMPVHPGSTIRKIDLLNEAVRDGVLETFKRPPAGVLPLLGFVVVGGDVTSYSPVPVSGIELPDLTRPRGVTPLGAALDAANDAIESTLASLSSQGLPYKAPTIAMFTDGMSRGESEDALPNAVKRSKALAATTRLQLIGLTLNQQDADSLKLAGMQTVDVIGNTTDWSEVFRWVSVGSLRGFNNMSDQTPYLD